MKCLVFLILLFSTHYVFSQNTEGDSLVKLLNNTNSDTTKANIYNHLAEINVNVDPDTTLFFAKKALTLSKSQNFLDGEIEALFYIGKSYLNVGELEQSSLSLLEGVSASKKTPNKTYKNIKNTAAIYNCLGNVNFSLSRTDLALTYYQIALKLRESINDSVGVIASYNNLGLIYFVKSNYKKALENHFISLKKAEKINDKTGMILSYNNLGKIYIDQQQLEKAQLYFSKAISIAKDLNLPNFVATASYNLADILLTKNDYQGALQRATDAYNLGKKINNNSNMVNALDIMGQAYLNLGEYNNALAKEFEGLRLTRVSDNKLNKVGVLSTLAKIYLKLKDYDKAINYGNQALKISKEVGNLTSTQIASKILAESYLEIQDYKNAYEMRTLSLIANDSIVSEASQQNLFKQAIAYDYEKQSLSDSLKYESIKKITTIENQNKLKNSRYQLIVLSIGLLIAIGLGLVLYKRFKITQTQKTIIESQKESLEIKTKEVRDSILYSKEIQNVFLKSIANNNIYFKDALLIYKPKDVVSGDFYWYKDTGDRLYVVVGDCTGHGVPGAIISVLAIQSLEKTILSVNELDQLHLVNQSLKDEFNQYYNKDNHVSIGLDYSIICLSKKDKMLYLSGSGGNILLKNKENKIISEHFESINIGGIVPVIYNPKTVCYPFTDIKSVFLYSDGFVDQRGGEKNKKFGTAQLKNLLENLKTKDTPETLAKIESAFEDWKGDNKQMDDVTLLGLQINA